MSRIFIAILLIACLIASAIGFMRVLAASSMFP